MLKLRPNKRYISIYTARHQKYFRKNKRLILYFIFFLSTSLLLISCGSNANKPVDPKFKPDKETYSVTLQEGTKIVKEDVVKKLISADKKSGVYKFNGTADEIANLNPGEIVIFAGHSIRKIKSISKQNNEYIVQTEYATLNQAIKDGEVSWEKKFDWEKGSPNISDASISSGDIVYAKENNSEFYIQYEGELKGWKVEFKLTPESHKLSIEILAKQEMRGVRTCVIKATGWLSNFTHNTKMIFHNGQLDLLEQSNNNLHGEMHIEFAAANLGWKIALIDIPATITVPLRVGIIPVEIKLKANLKIYPDVRLNASAQANYKLTYNSDIGFTFNREEVKPKGNLNSHKMSIEGKTVSAGFITTGMGVGIEFPRFETAVFGELIVPYFLLNTSVSTFYEPGLLSNTPPCQQGTMKFKCAAGINAEFLGVHFSHEKKIWEKERKWQSKGSHCN